MLKKLLKNRNFVVYNSLNSRKGSIVTTLGIASAALGLAIAVGSLVLNSQKMAKLVSNESSSLLLNNLGLTRVAQAISSTAVLCSHTTELCFWNEDNKNIALENFGFSNYSASSAKGEPMKLDVEVCIPEFKSTGVNLTSCTKKTAKVEIRIKNIDDLMSLAASSGDSVGVLSGTLDTQGNTVDNDRYGILIKVSSTYLDFSQEEKIADTTGIVRRPRFLTRIETSDGFCAPTCQVSSLGDSESDTSFKKSNVITTDSGEQFALLEGNVPKPQSFCLGGVRVINNESAGYSFLKPASIEADGTGVGKVGTYSDGKAALSAFNSTKAINPLRVYNDGPVYLYNFSLKRTFEKNKNYSFAPG